MRKSNPQLELQVLATICNVPSQDTQFKLFAQVAENHFGVETYREAFQRITAIVNSGNRIPSLRLLAEDMNISSQTRAALSQLDARPFRSEADFTSGVTTLSAHYKNRRLLSLHETITKALQEDGGPQAFEAVEKALEETIFHLRSDVNEEKILDGTAGSMDMLKLAERALQYAHKGRRFKTGWGEFDKLTGGLEPGNVLLLTANTGGGKSIAAMSLLANMYRGFGQSVTYISLEMDEREMMERLISNATATEIAKIRGGMHWKEAQALYHRYKTEFHQTSHGRYSFYSPKGDYTIEQLLAQVQGKPTDVIILDYLGLVRPGGYGKNSSEEFQLRQMTRYAKRFAEKAQCAVVLLAQLNDEGQIMYSKGIGHHVHYWLKWMAKEEDFTRGYVVMEMGKSRNSRKQDLYMSTDFHIMRMENITEPADAAARRASAAEGPPQKKHSDAKQGGRPAGQQPQNKETDLSGYGMM